MFSRLFALSRIWSVWIKPMINEILHSLPAEWFERLVLSAYTEVLEVAKRADLSNPEKRARVIEYIKAQAAIAGRELGETAIEIIFRAAFKKFKRD